jgi:gentisate 1,2-dioxygenase
MELEDFNRWLSERHMGGFWNIKREGGEQVKPHVFKWSEIYQALTMAADLVPMEQVAMRTVQLKNPGLSDRMSNSLHFSAQILMPGERTKAHRNLVSETRFVVDAPDGAEFIVDGESFPMGQRDVVTTPNWSWHDHHNGGDRPAIWLDGMDTRLVGVGKSINEPFRELHQPVERRPGYSASRLGHARPAWITHDREMAPMHYTWAATREAIRSLVDNEVDPDPSDGLLLVYENPVTGGPTYKTYAAQMQLLGSHFSGKASRRNSTTVFHVVEGSGTTVVDDERLEWSKGDIFIVPPWSWHRHENVEDGDALLYSISDWPAMQALGLYREDRQD